MMMCAEHGEQPETFVCQHIVETLHDERPRGFHWSAESTQPYPDAWCSACNERLRSADWEWTDDTLAFARVRLLCAGCYSSCQGDQRPHLGWVCERPNYRSKSRKRHGVSREGDITAESSGDRPALFAGAWLRRRPRVPAVWAVQIGDGTHDRREQHRGRHAFGACDAERDPLLVGHGVV